MRGDFAALEAGLPKTIAGRIECLDNWFRGVPIVNECGCKTGERTAPLISRETYEKLLRATVELPELP